MVVPKKTFRIEQKAIFETAARLRKKKGLSQKAALKEAFRDANSPSGTLTKTKNRFSKRK